MSVSVADAVRDRDRIYGALSHADCEHSAFGTNRLHRPRPGRWLCRTDYRIDPARVLGPCHRRGRDTFASISKMLRRLLQRRHNASVFAQGCADLSSGSANRRPKFARYLGWIAPQLCSDLSFRYTQAARVDPGRAVGQSAPKGRRGKPLPLATRPSSADTLPRSRAPGRSSLAAATWHLSFRAAASAALSWDPRSTSPNEAGHA
jgi:hypothetical protein